jgi:uncharacterized protein YqjF (DUF2071 family)
MSATVARTPQIYVHSEAPFLFGSSNNLSAKPSLSFESVTSTDWNHFSAIVYAVPVERVRDLLPASVDLEEITITDAATGNHKSYALISVVSFLDSGSCFVMGSHHPFEQMLYRVHVCHQGRQGFWLLGVSAGSLTAVSSRRLWSLPWHLSAMEFQISREAETLQYTDYHLRSFSREVNALVEIADTGVAVVGDICELLPRISSSWFQRKDGDIGEYRVTHSSPQFTRGQIRAARFDLLEKLGLLSTEEMRQPLMVMIQQNVTTRIQGTVSEKSADLAAVKIAC